MEVYNPYDRSLIHTLQYQHDVEIPEVDPPPKQERIAILEQILRGMEERKEELVTTAISEGGKPLQDTLVEFDRALMGVRSAIATLMTRAGEMIPMDLNGASSGRMGFTVEEPIGVVLAISAFNHPINNIIHQVIPAIATGCPILVKPAERTPLSCQILVEIFQAAGATGCEMLTVELPTLQQVIPHIAYLSFIGSADVGWQVRSQLPAGASCMLEHGGSAPVILLDDVDIDRALPSLVKGAFYHAGQVCVSIQRIFCHASRMEELQQKLCAATEKLVVGDPLSPDTDVGPMIEPDRVDRMETLTKEGKVLCGGKRLSDTCFAPTVMADPSSRLQEEEIFGPITCLLDYSDLAEAIGQANGPPFTFQGSVYGREMERLMETARQLKGQTVMINQPPTFRVDWMPFGGRELSGQRLGGIPYVMRELSPQKLIIV
jgi:acyl-CoA reductase-like NAD-dependent aldehyde dehydrogenase